MASMRVEVVSPERQVWSGEARMVVARTLDGELGVLPGHVPLLGVLADGGTVRIQPADGGAEVVAAVSGGFLSVSADGVSVLAEEAELGPDIDVAAAREALSRAGDDAAAARRAESRLRAAGAL